MNKKGFTLVELLASIVILALILAIAVPSVTGIANSLRKSDRQNVIKNLEIGAARYAFDTGNEIIFVEDLINNGYIESENDKVIDPVSNESLNCYILTATLEGEHYKATFKEGKNYVNYNGTCNRTSAISDVGQIIATYNGTRISDNREISIRKISGAKIRLQVSGVNCNGTSRCVWSNNRGLSTVGNYYYDIVVDNTTDRINTRYNFQQTVYNSDGTTTIINKSINLKINFT